MGLRLRDTGMWGERHPTGVTDRGMWGGRHPTRALATQNEEEERYTSVFSEGW